MSDVSDIFHSAESNLLLLKLTGVVLALGAIFYFIFSRKMQNTPTSTWKEVVILAIALGGINAGIVMFMGKIAYYITPTALGLLLLLGLAKKFPSLWKINHILAFGLIFVVSSVVVFLSIALIFFKLSVEGKF